MNMYEIQTYIFRLLVENVDDLMIINVFI